MRVAIRKSEIYPESTTTEIRLSHVYKTVAFTLYFRLKFIKLTQYKYSTGLRLLPRDQVANWGNDLIWTRFWILDHFAPIFFYQFWPKT